ncbi:protease inhibitor Inh/omp19 family protein [Ancylobacter sonchi]|uniref:protease inhibitor Inh/omp19 family protein n=1 Tax=Ancylobacter sonchi TaxID=1937790 RepID=UPI001BD2C1C1|nr:protease inhibitor Inh/omp19 family protein [Ancylobacter sonchi]MBS7535114.1 protease inhibitor Inh/omp19 family protein [Ancylobacter sonchi]
MKITALAAVSATALLLAGCSTALDGFGEHKTAAVDANAITPAPTGSVESAPVPSPAPTGATAATAGDAVTPRQQSAAAATTVPLTQPGASAPGGVAYAEPGATRTQLAGNWSYSWDNGAKSCKLNLSTERGMSGFAANADVGCPNDIFMTKGWDVWGNEIVLQNHLGKVTARLQPAGDGHYDGVATGDGAKVSLSRS